MPVTLCLVVLGRQVDRLEFLDVLLGERRRHNRCVIGAIVSPRLTEKPMGPGASRSSRVGIMIGARDHNREYRHEQDPPTTALALHQSLRPSQQVSRGPRSAPDERAETDRPRTPIARELLDRVHPTGSWSKELERVPELSMPDCGSSDSWTGSALLLRRPSSATRCRGEPLQTFSFWTSSSSPNLVSLMGFGRSARAGAALA